MSAIDKALATCAERALWAIKRRLSGFVSLSLYCSFAYVVFMCNNYLEQNFSRKQRADKQREVAVLPSHRFCTKTVRKSSDFT